MARESGTAEPSSVQSVGRTLDLLEVLAARGGRSSIADLAADAGLPAPTVHRLARTLVERGYLRQLRDRTYTLGYRLVPLGAAANALVGSNAEAVLGNVVAELGETANLAVLSGNQAEYVAQVPSLYTMRTFTELGRRVDLHSTGVGKALLARLADEDVHKIVRRQGLARQTPHTITTESALLSDLSMIRTRGFATDDEEQEIGVRCVAVTMTVPELAGIAVSVSGPVTRMTDSVVTRAVPVLHSAAAILADDLAGPARGERLPVG